MIRTGRLLLAVTIVFATLPLDALPPYQGCEDRDPDTGTQFCGHICKTTSVGSSCNPEAGNPRPGYCWQVIFTQENVPPACHQDEYSECCDTTGGF